MSASLTDELKSQKTSTALHSYGVSLAYLFGSYATGNAIDTSDVDIAVLFDESFDSGKRFQFLTGLGSELMNILARNDVDIVSLHDASPLLRYKVYEKGKLFYFESQLDRIKFEVKAMRDYFDTHRLREIQKRSYLKRSA